MARSHTEQPERCTDCQQDKDYCCDCDNGSLYISPDMVGDLDLSEWEESDGQ